jgi:predicted PurR-regulated permease PerM
MTDSRGGVAWEQIALFLLTLGVLILCGLLLYPMFLAILGAIVLAVVTRRPYDWLARRVRNRSLCAALALFLVILSIILPCFFLAQDIGQQASGTIQALRERSTQQRFTELLASHPALAARIQTVSAAIDLNHAAQEIASYLGSRLAGLVRNSVSLITQLLILLFLLFFLFRDRAFALASLRSLLPLREEETTELLERVGGTINATALGRLTIACVQGVLAGLAFWVLGVPGVVLWAFTTVACAMIPAFGSFLVWGPIALYLGFSGHWGKAALLALWGGVIVGTIDNFLYPILVGSQLRAHTVTILISILGGIAFFGVTGIILGPVLFTVAATLLDFWRARSANQPAP